MAAPSREDFSERMPTAIETKNAGQLLQIMSGLVKEGEPTKLSLALAKDRVTEVTLHPAIANTFIEILRLISSGKGFQLLPLDAEFTTQQAADLLNVSRPHLIKLLEQKQIPHTKTGRHRRIRADDLFAYKEKRDQTRAAALAAMAQDDAEHGRI
jgi:excisionase family DNA binding protein